MPSPRLAARRRPAACVLALACRRAAAAPPPERQLPGVDDDRPAAGRCRWSTATGRHDRGDDAAGHRSTPTATACRSAAATRSPRSAGRPPLRQDRLVRLQAADLRRRRDRRHVAASTRSSPSTRGARRTLAHHAHGPVPERQGAATEDVLLPECHARGPTTRSRSAAPTAPAARSASSWTTSPTATTTASLDASPTSARRQARHRRSAAARPSCAPRAAAQLRRRRPAHPHHLAGDRRRAQGRPRRRSAAPAAGAR